MSEITRNQAIQIVEDIRTAISAGSVTNTMEAQVLEYCVSVLGRRIVEASLSGHIENLPDVAAFLAGISPSATLRALLNAITEKIPAEASGSNNLADKAFVTALTNALQNAVDTINGKIPAEASRDNKLADKAFVTALTNALQNAVDTINANIGNGYVYAGIATPSGTPVSGKVFYLARQAGQYTNFGGLTVTEGINILKRNGSAWTQEQLLSMADIYKNPLIGYYECDTAGDTAAKAVTAAGYVLPATGGSVKIKMANRNTVANATLNINSTGAKPLYYNGQRAGVGNTWDTNEIIEVFYDGAKYQAYNVAGCGVYETLAPMFEQSEEFDFPVTGKYLNDNAEEVSGANKLCTDYIPCKKGDEFVFNSSDNQTRFFVFDENKQNPVMLWKGVSTDQHLYICDSSYKYIRACSSTTDTSHYLRRLIKTTYDDTLEKISDVIKEDCVSFADANTGYIQTNGTFNTNSGRYKEFQVYKGTIMELQAAGGNPIQNLIHTNQCFIAKKVGNSYIPLVLGSEVTLADIPYYYTFTEPMICCVSFYYADDTNKRAIRLKFTTNYAKSALEGTRKLENDNANLNQDLQIKDIDLGYMFDNIAVIGDSMSVGSLSSGSEAEPVNNFGASWLSFLAKRWGCKSRYHYAKGGTNTYSWLNDANIFGFGLMLADTKIYNAYFIAYGHNDGGLAVGSATDEAAPVTITEGVPSCPTGYSFCAYYKAIINQIRAKAPHAMIFCLPEYDSLMAGSSRAAYRQAIIDIAELYYNNGDKLVHHLDTGGVPDSEMVLGTHYSTVGWAYIAKRVDDEAKKIMYQYRGDTDVNFFGGYNCENVR